LRPLLNLAGRLSVAGISEADVCLAFAARIHQQLPDSVRSANLGNGFNQFERKKPARASAELQHSTPGASAARARHALPAFFPLWRRLHPCIQVYRGNSTKKARLYILNLAHTPDNFFSPFLSLYSAATAGHKNGVEGHKDGVKKAVLVTRAEWRSHERSEQDRSLVTLESQKRSEAGILKCSCDRNYRNIL